MRIVCLVRTKAVVMFWRNGGFDSRVRINTPNTYPSNVASFLGASREAAVKNDSDKESLVNYLFKAASQSISFEITCAMLVILKEN